MPKATLDSTYAMNSHTLETSADHAARRIYLFGQVNADTALRFIVALHRMDATDGDISVFLSSYGGEIESGLAIFDAIKMARNRVVICGMGPVMSMGLIVLQAADLRLLAPNSRVLLHDGFGGHESSLVKLGALGREAVSSVERTARIVADRSGLPLMDVFSAMQAETFYSAEEALEKGFCDGIAIPHPKDHEIHDPPGRKPRRKTKRRSRR